MIRVPARAITGTGSHTRVFLTEREALTLCQQDGYGPRVGDLLADQTVCLSTGAKVSQVPAWMRSKVCPTRARVFQVYGYHWAGTDVTSLVGAA